MRAPSSHTSSERKKTAHASIGLVRRPMQERASRNNPAAFAAASPVGEALGEILREHVVTTSAAPGAAAAAAQRTESGWVTVTAAAGTMDPFGADPVTPDTWYDLASLTKSVTAVSVARAVEEGLLCWQTPLGTYLPELGDTFAGAASIENLLSHRAGLVAHVPGFEAPATALQRMAQAHRPEVARTATGDVAGPHPPLYSDLGYVLVGEALRRVTHGALDEWLAYVLERGVELGSARQLQERGVALTEVAPTELVPARGGLVRLQVHDDNAWALSETGCSGHAGLFGTASGVLAFGMSMLDCVAGRSTWLSKASLGVLLTQRPDGVLRAGFDGKSGTHSSAGTELGSHTFGHLGFTGTSYWCDPESETVVVLLTNRVCPKRDNPRLRQVRPLVADAMTRLARALTR